MDSAVPLVRTRVWLVMVIIAALAAIPTVAALQPLPLGPDDQPESTAPSDVDTEVVGDSVGGVGGGSTGPGGGVVRDTTGGRTGMDEIGDDVRNALIENPATAGAIAGAIAL